MREKLHEFMNGRNGVDDLSNVFVVLILVCMVLSMVTKIGIFSIIAFVLLIWMYFRIFSRNTSKRYEENQKYLNFRYDLTRKLQRRKERRAQSRDYRFFDCPTCKQTVRVPRGRGRIEITCPKCSAQFIRKS